MLHFTNQCLEIRQVKVTKNRDSIHNSLLSPYRSVLCIISVLRYLESYCNWLSIFFFFLIRGCLDNWRLLPNYSVQRVAEGCLSVDDSVLIKVSVGYWKLFLYLSVVLSFFFFVTALCRSSIWFVHGIENCSEVEMTIARTLNTEMAMAM